MAFEVAGARKGVLGAIGEGLAEFTVLEGQREAAVAWGGDAANACVMAARLGHPARFAGRVGNDTLGRGLTAFWRANAVDTRWVLDDPAAPTGIYMNETDPTGGHRFTYWRHQSAGSRLNPTDIPSSFYAGLGALLVTGVTLAVSESSAATANAAIDAAKAQGVLIVCVLNHRSRLGGSIGELAKTANRSDILIASDEDLLAVYGHQDGHQIASERERPGEVVVTSGNGPARLFSGGRTWSQPVPPVTVRNAAGAGDAFAGSYLAARLGGEQPDSCLSWGVAAASLSVGREGCARSYPAAAETATMRARLVATEIHEQGS